VPLNQQGVHLHQLGTADDEQQVATKQGCSSYEPKVAVGGSSPDDLSDLGRPQARKSGPEYKVPWRRDTGAEI